MVENEDGTQRNDGLISELRRGVLALAVLSQCDEPQYGYSLKQRLADLGLDINEGTLYPLLRRLEGQGLLHSEWRVVDETRPRRYYVLDEPGRAALDSLQAEWRSLVAVVERIRGNNLQSPIS
jgi:PadR family transcriptional regulator PadR